MRFVLAMVAREMRATWRRLLFFFLSIAVGVAAIVALRSVIQCIRQALASESRTITASDILIESNRPWSDDVQRIIADRLEQAPVLARTDSIETTTMVRLEGEAEGVATMVELRAIQPAFPFYGEFELEGGKNYTHDLLAGGGALVRPELLARLGVQDSPSTASSTKRVAPVILIGSGRFTVRGLIVKEPGRIPSMFNLGPRVIVDYADLARTGLIQFGSRVEYQILLKVAEEGIDALVGQLREELEGEFVRVRSFRETGDRLGRRLARTEDHLSLAGFIILVLGGIGVWSVVRVFVHQKLKSIAVLKCVGASSRQILAVYLLQVLGLGIAGSLLGIGVARAAVELLKSGIGVEIEGVSYQLTTAAVGQGLGIGLLVCLLFSLVPLLEVRRVKPLTLLRPGAPGPVSVLGGPRHRIQAAIARIDRWQALASTMVLLALLGLAGWQAGSIRVGLYLSAGLAGCGLSLHLVGIALVRAVEPLGRKAWFPLRHAVFNVSRTGNQTRVILLAVGLGSFFILTIKEIETNMLDQFALELREDAPDMFLLDIQPDQVEPLEETARSLGASRVNMVPVLRARVTAVRGSEISLDGPAEVRRRGSLGREYVVTYRDHLDPNERILAGSFWSGTPYQEAEVSIEESLSRRYRIRVGDTMQFDILGRVMSARVTSIREVEWNDARNGGFMFVFRPGALEGAPRTYLGFIKGPPETSRRGRFQRDLIAGFHNLTIIDLRDVLQTLREVLERVSLGITVVGAVALFSGGLILVGSVAMTKFQRSYETAIFRTLGATKRSVAIMMFMEYAVLGALAGAIGAIGALVMTWAMSRHVLDIPWEPAVGLSFSGIGLAAVGVSTVGVAATLQVLKHKPLSILRAE